MIVLQKGFVNRNGKEFKNITNVCLSGDYPFMEFGKFVHESKDNLATSLADSGFNELGGVYIYMSGYNSKIALRVYKDMFDYKFTHYRDDELVSKLQNVQKKVKLTDFPTGIISIEGHVIGQEIPYYHDAVSITEAIIDKKLKDNPIEYYKKILDILIELKQNGVEYIDVHGKNFMYLEKEDKIKLIDFDDKYLTFDCPYGYKNMIQNLKKFIKNMNGLNNIKTPKILENTETLEDVYEVILNKTFK